MKRNGSVLVEAVLVCFISLIVTASVASIFYSSTMLVSISKDDLILERVREEVLSKLQLCSLSAAVNTSAEGCYIEIVPSVDGDNVIHIFRDGFKGRRESFVLWPHKDGQE